MLKHYLKITIRNILANKFNYLLTTLGLAVGIAIFAVVYFMVDVLDHYCVDFPDESNLYKIDATIGETDRYSAISISFSTIEKIKECESVVETVRNLFS